MSDFATLAGSGQLNGGQMSANARLACFLPQIEHNFNPVNITQVGTGRVFNAQIMPGAGQMQFLQGNPGPLAKLLMEVFQKGNVGISEVAGNNLNGIEHLAVEGVSYGGDFSSMRGSLSPSSAGGSAGRDDFGVA